MRETFKEMVIEDHVVHIYLPPSYQEGDKHYPVVYMQDGSYLAKNCLNLLEHKVKVQEIPEIILVGVVPNNRYDEYTPFVAASLTGTYADFGGNGAAYLNYLIEKVKPFVDTTYRTKPEPAYTGIIGASLGGLLSIYAALTKPDVFGKIGALSASFWFEGFLSFLEEVRLSKSNQKIYMSVGTLEGVYKQGIQRNMIPFTYQAHHTLLQKGYPKKQLKFSVENGGTHDKVFFTKHFVQALEWLFN